MNVEIFALYIFSRFSRLSNMRENIYNVKLTFIIPHTSNKIEYANLSPCKIANFRKFAKIYTRGNIYFHSIQRKCFHAYPQQKSQDTLFFYAISFNIHRITNRDSFVFRMNSPFGDVARGLLGMAKM